MTQTSEQWQMFEDLVRRILEANGFAVTYHSPRGYKGFDFVGSLGSAFWAIEVKYYRTNRPQAHLIEAAAARVANRGSGAQQYSGMLVVSCSRPPSMRLALEEKFNITFIDRLDLDTLTSKHPLLNEELQVLLGSNLSPLLEEVKQPKALFKQRILFAEKSPPAEDTIPQSSIQVIEVRPMGGPA